MHSLAHRLLPCRRLSIVFSAKQREHRRFVHNSKHRRYLHIRVHTFPDRGWRFCPYCTPNPYTLPTLAFDRQEVLEPQFVLVLAWALGQVVKDVQTAEYLSGALETGIPPYMLPALISVSGPSLAPESAVCSASDGFKMIFFVAWAWKYRVTNPIHGAMRLYHRK